MTTDHHKFFLPDCLDKMTLEYFCLGLDDSAIGCRKLSKSGLIEEIADILNVPASCLYDRTVSYDRILSNALNRFREILNPEADSSMGNLTVQIKGIVRALLEVIGKKSSNLSFVDLTLRLPDEYYPYMMLFVLEPSRPEWMLINGRMLDHKIKYGFGAMEFLRNNWNAFMLRKFKSRTEVSRCNRLLFTVCLIVILRNEVSKLHTFGDLANLPLEIPRRRSSVFLREKTQEFNDIRQYAELLLGIFENAKTNRRQHETNIDARVERQILGMEAFGISKIEPRSFTEWQVKAILSHPDTLDPIVALLSTLRYEHGGNGTEIARLYFEYLPYQEKVKEKRTLFTNHFFPYIFLSSGDVVLSEDGFAPVMDSEGEFTGDFQEVPVCVEGIDTGLMDLMYLYFNNLDTGILRQLRRNDQSGCIDTDNGDAEKSDYYSFDIIQGEKIDPITIKRYYQFISRHGEWRQVKDRFEAEVECRVSKILRDFRHNILQHLGPLEGNEDKIICFIEDNFPDNDRKRRILDIARSSKRGLRRSVVQLDSLKIDHSKHDLMPFNRKMETFIKDLSNNKSVEIIWDKGSVPDDMMFTFFGENGIQFYVMMQNVVQNAYDHGFNVMDGKYNLPARPQIKIEANVMADVLRLQIMNNGKPLPDDFDTFDYITAGVSRSAGNSGLGGAQVDSIVRMHGGSLSILKTDEWNFILQMDFKI